MTSRVIAELERAMPRRATIDSSTTVPFGPADPVAGRVDRQAVERHAVGGEHEVARQQPGLARPASRRWAGR